MGLKKRIPKPFGIDQRILDAALRRLRDTTSPPEKVEWARQALRTLDGLLIEVHSCIQLPTLRNRSSSSGKATRDKALSRSS